MEIYDRAPFNVSSFEEKYHYTQKCWAAVHKKSILEQQFLRSKDTKRFTNLQKNYLQTVSQF